MAILSTFVFIFIKQLSKHYIGDEEKQTINPRNKFQISTKRPFSYSYSHTKNTFNRIKLIYSTESNFYFQIKYFSSFLQSHQTFDKLISINFQSLFSYCAEKALNLNINISSTTIIEKLFISHPTLINSFSLVYVFFYTLIFTLLLTQIFLLLIFF